MFNIYFHRLPPCSHSIHSIIQTMYTLQALCLRKIRSFNGTEHHDELIRVAEILRDYFPHLYQYLMRINLDIQNPKAIVEFAYLVGRGKTSTNVVFRRFFTFTEYFNLRDLSTLDGNVIILIRGETPFHIKFRYFMRLRRGGELERLCPFCFYPMLDECEDIEHFYSKYSKDAFTVVDQDILTRDAVQIVSCDRNWCSKCYRKSLFSDIHAVDYCLNSCNTKGVGRLSGYEVIILASNVRGFKFDRYFDNNSPRKRLKKFPYVYTDTEEDSE